MLNPAAAVAAAAAARHSVPPGPGPGPGQQGFKINIVESIERIKEEFNFLQAQYHNLKLDCEKLVQEKTEMQRHYVMYYEMSYGLNVEMHKQRDQMESSKLHGGFSSVQNKHVEEHCANWISLNQGKVTE
eukprot:maker-scaffold91_size383040-snap-gene-2.24 protein:Tk03193 transcript:maker-scaffold91_size383040-snap-gene-2.24-mRNA-1 annotation:"hypothetical protein AND_007352"